MPSLPPELLDILGDLVVDMRETFEADGHTVDSATALNVDFRRNNRPRSELTRAIMAGALERGAGRLGLNYRDGKGGAAELHESIPSAVALIRLKRAHRAGSEFRVAANAATSLNGEIDEDTLLPEYHYVFGWILEDDGPLEFFVAQITGVDDGNPGWYIFGWAHEFVVPTQPSGSGFQPQDDDDLGGWERDEDRRDKPA